MTGLTNLCARCGSALKEDGFCGFCNCLDRTVKQPQKAETEDEIYSLTGKSQQKVQIGTAVLVNKGTMERYPLTQSVSKIGRDATNSIALPKDSYISRHHAWILYIKGSYWVEDLGSTNGTMLNGELLNERKQVFPGDCIKLGRTELIFEVA